MDIQRARLAAQEYRALRQLPDRACDASIIPAGTMATEIQSLALGAGIIEPCHDDSEECVHCAFPEHAAVVIKLDGRPVCREHIWRALTGTLGVRDRHI